MMSRDGAAVNFESRLFILKITVVKIQIVAVLYYYPFCMFRHTAGNFGIYVHCDLHICSENARQVGNDLICYLACGRRDACLV